MTCSSHSVFVNIDILCISLSYNFRSRTYMVHMQYILYSSLNYSFFALAAFRGRFRDSSGQPPSIDTDTDHLQPAPEDDGFDSRQDQAAMEAAITDFIKRLEVQEKQGIWTQFCPTCRVLERWTKLEFLSPLPWKQVCCSEWLIRRHVTSPPLKCFSTSMPKIAGV